MEKKYYLGLDIGTNSCGYAVTDESYNILKVKGKKAWGVRLFPQAKTAEERRLMRGNRRRLARRKWKISWLQEIFAPEIIKIDPHFLSRLKYSNLWEEDKKKMNVHLQSKDALFTTMHGEPFTDKDFYKLYPTVYHLRKELLHTPTKDIRFLYLALHNIIKRRGHFLYEGEYGNNGDLISAVNEVLKKCDEVFNQDIPMVSFTTLTKEDEGKLLEIIMKTKSVKEKKKQFIELLQAGSKQSQKIVEVMLDGKGDIKNIFVEKESLKFDFANEEYDTATLPLLESALTDEEMSVLDAIKNVYNIIKLKEILGDSTYICESMVNAYNVHKQQLAMFKKFIKTYYPKDYFSMFRSPYETSTNYAMYINLTSVKGNKQVVGTNKNGKIPDKIDRSRESFYKTIKMVLSQEPTLQKGSPEQYTSLKQDILQSIENQTFLLKQRSRENAVLPNKLYVGEIKQILETNAKEYTFLYNKDASGFTNAEKIIQILEFRIPYFVGPVGASANQENVFAWCKKQSNQPIKPWNIQSIINFDEAENEFIQRMTNTCTYLPNENVLPKKSVLYSKFMVLNELNNLKIDGNSITVALKQQIFIHLFQHYKKVTVKMIKDFLVAQGCYTKEEMKSISITGIDKEFVNNYASYVSFVNILGESFVQAHIPEIEKIILYHTVISDKKRLEKRLQTEFSNILTVEQIKQIKALSFTGWGRLSRKFLQGIQFVNQETGEVTTIIEQMWNTNQNLMQILHNGTYTLGQQLQTKAEKTIQNIGYEDVDNLYCSPAVKRGVWQTLKMVKEIANLMGGLPERVFVEVTRHDDDKGEKGRKLSRKENLLKMYQSKEFQETLQKFQFDVDAITQGLQNQENNALRSEKLYLYYLQLGKCAYSGESIDIEKINNEQYYDIDHIIPQSIIKNDSLENKVLVKSVYNKNKGDVYPISQKYPQWVATQKSFWEMLVHLKLMSSEKYAKLVRNEALTDAEIGGFINRQLVETNQTAQAVIDILKGVMGDAQKVIHAKAKFVSDFRNQQNIVKCREVNNLHHAKDAYLNIVVGNVLYHRFTADPRNFYKTENNNNTLTKNVNKLFNFKIKKFHTEDIIWNGVDDIEKVKAVCQQNDCIVSRMSNAKSNGAFYNQTLYKSVKNNPNTLAKIERKGSEKNPLHSIEKYGGYDNLYVAYFMLVQSEDKKGNFIKTLEAVPIYLLRQLKNDAQKEEKILAHIASASQLNHAKTLLSQIPIQSTLKINKGTYVLAGKTGNHILLHNANEWFVNNETAEYIKAITKYIDLKIAKKDADLKEVNGKVVLSPASKFKNKEVALSYRQNEILYQNILQQLQKPIYQGLPLSNVLYKKLVEKETTFMQLSVLQQAELLYKVMLRVGPGNFAADLTLIHEGANTAKIFINKNITNLNIQLVVQSPTGLQQKYIQL